MEIKSVSTQPVIDVAFDTIARGKQALVFVESKRSAEKTADDIARVLRKHYSTTTDSSKLAEKVYKSVSSPTKQCQRLKRCLSVGIAFHHSGLVSKQRELIEDAFRKGDVHVICATPTLAYGVSTPAFRVVVKSLKRFSGKWGMAWIPVLDYLQMAGRAGRPEFNDTHGEVVLIAKDDVIHDQIHTQYVLGKPESIFSKLAVEPVLRTYVLSLIATGFARTRAQLLTFFSKTFWAYQYKDMLQLERIIDKMIQLLEQWSFILTTKDDFVSAAELGEVGLRATLLGRRVAELYLDPFTAHHIIKGMKIAKIKGTQSFALLQLFSATLEMRPLLRVRAKEHDIMQEVLLEHYGNLLMIEPSVYDPGYDDFLHSIKTAHFFSEWIDEKTEEELFEQYGVRPGEIRSKVSRADWLIYAAAELLPLLDLHSLVKDVKKLRIRVQYGVREELLPLLRLHGVGRKRARKLLRAKLKDITALKKVDQATLAHIVGAGVAVKIKEQLGQKVALKLGKRKGQMALGKY
jgi:helicase